MKSRVWRSVELNLGEVRNLMKFCFAIGVVITAGIADINV